MLISIYQWGNRGVWIAAAVTATLLFYAIVYAFPNARQIALLQECDAIEKENRAFCEKYRMPFGTAEHTWCAADLTDIRANKHKRSPANPGIF